MLEKLKFVERATATKDVIRILTHLCIHDGKVQGGDSKIAIEVDCPELAGHSFTVDSIKFIKAVTACDDQPKIELLEDGRVKISKGRFVARLPTLKADAFPRAELRSAGDATIVTPDKFIETLRRVSPFISLDASRPWSQGVWLDGAYAYATNNVSMVRLPLVWAGPKINIPRYAVEELISINQPIKSIHVTKGSIAVEYDDSWFKAMTYVDEWPQGTIDKLFSQMPASMTPVPDGLMQAVERIVPFCPEPKFPTIYFKNGSISTADGAESAEVGMDWNGTGAYRVEALQRVLEVAKEWMPDTYPAPIYFKADDMDGLLVGIRT